jgi:hypothetical protein
MPLAFAGRWCHYYCMIAARKLPKKVLPCATDADPWLRLSQKNRLIYRKEAIYLGDFGKLNAQGKGIEFAIARDTVTHWKRSVDQLLENEVTIPLARSHAEWSDPERRLGKVIAAEIGRDSKDRHALFLDIEFDDEQSRDIALKGDISIGSPPVWFDGLKRRYEYPLQHVASTSAPVIPGLDEWHAIAAAFNLAQYGGTMDVDQLIELMQIEVPEGSDTDEAKWALIHQWVKERCDTMPPAEEPTDDAPVEASKATPAAPVAPAANGAAKKVTATVAFSHENPPPVLVINTVCQARKAIIDAEVTAGTFAPTVGADLVGEWCDQKKVELSIINNEDNSAFERELARWRKAKKNPPLSAAGRSKGSVPDDELELSQSIDSDSFLKHCEETTADEKRRLTGAGA